MCIYVNREKIGLCIFFDLECSKIFLNKKMLGVLFHNIKGRLISLMYSNKLGIIYFFKCRNCELLLY